MYECEYDVSLVSISYTLEGVCIKTSLSTAHSHTTAAQALTEHELQSPEHINDY